jgi:hypothetical protein
MMTLLPTTAPYIALHPLHILPVNAGGGILEEMLSKM